VSGNSLRHCNCPARAETPDALLGLIKAGSTSSIGPAARSAGLFSQADLTHAFAL
jgi:hypothetical protein